MARQKNKILGFVHIEKTAGTSLIHILRHNFFMRYMDKEPERCIFQDPPECPPDLSWAFFDGEIDGDLPLSKKNQERTRRSPRIRKKK